MQQTNLMLKYSETPVVVAPAGQALGGGCEIVMYAQKVQAAVETYIGLVEVAAGVIPAGGGCAAMLDRWQQISLKLGERGPFAPARHAFEIIATATVATSAYDAMNYGFLLPSAGVTWDRDRLLAERQGRRDCAGGGEGARRVAAAHAADLPVAGRGRTAGARKRGGGAARPGQGDGLRRGGGEQAGLGADRRRASPLATLTEQDILDLEREAFLSLCGNEKTQARMEALLTTGKPLRN